jgi:hypothetical protein
VFAFNGASIGKGHLAEAKAAVKGELSGSKSVFQRNGHHDHSDAPAPAANGQREELLAKLNSGKTIPLKSE